ncbi:MAG: sulfonate ABC transporter substrate-binding protein [Candidatus Reconcilbacillus cellulovorans]|uniref:Putative aliphatic sulfonates-binding protein n=1 Tax=Candidatus Reconcilbacillus cellulovorans TaxID=1906605 RepID=A0A2A6E187_9BACL|nr:MAG: sulfonate ABC transporter substrate-binding protein [Candidatus Reconcilbacillus cellulovorans]
MNRRNRIKRTWATIALVASAVLAVSGCGSAKSAAIGAKNGSAATAENRVSATPSALPTNVPTDGTSAPGAAKIRIGYQKYGTLSILKADGGLEKKLNERGVKVEWTEFPGGPQLLEALNAGSIDVGHTGEAPPIFAQAAGAPLVYLAHEPPSPKSEAIVVPKDSPIRTVADLKGKTIVLNKGSNVHYLLVKLLEKNGLSYHHDIQVKFLPPADARVAFEKGNVDAWVIWDPFLAAAQTGTDARILADGTDLVSNHEFYLAARPFAEQHPDLVDLLLREVDRIDTWAREHPREVAEKLSPQLGIDAASLELAAKRRPYGIQPIDETIVRAQQQIADTFLALGLIPKAIDVREALLRK